MNILEIAIQAEEGVGKLASAINVRQNVISNWRARGIPKPWEALLSIKYRKHIKAAQAATTAQAATNSVAQA